MINLKLSFLFYHYQIHIDTMNAVKTIVHLFPILVISVYLFEVLMLKFLNENYPNYHIEFLIK